MSITELLAALAAAVADLETKAAEVDALRVEVARLSQALADCEAQPDPEPVPEPEPEPEPEPTPEPEPEPPPIVVDEPFPANPAVILSPGANVQNALASGKVVELKPGPYGDQRLNIPAGSYVFCRSGRAEFKHPHAGKCKDHPFCTQGGGGVTLRGVIVDGYSALPKSGSNYEGAGAIWFQSSMTKWSLLDIDFKNIFDTCVRGGGGLGHRIERYTATNVGRYVFANFSGLTAKNGKVFHIADGVGVPKASDSDRGFMKFAGGSKDCTIDTLEMTDVDGSGCWWDGFATNGIARNIKATRVSGNVCIAEVSFGPFLFENIEAYGSAELTPTPMKRSIVLAHWTPDVTVRDVYGENSGNGVTAHAYDRDDIQNGAGGHSSTTLKQKLGNHRLNVDGLELKNMGRYSAGWAGRSTDYLGRKWEGMVWKNGNYDSGAKFRVGSQDLNLAQWLATPYGE